MEHAWPKWLDKEAPLRTAATNVTMSSRIGPGVRAKNLRVRNQKVRRVCHACNGGWMNDLENNVKPILRPMLKGISRTLNKSEQAILATWVVKTAWMLEFLDSSIRRPVPADHYRYLKEHQEPPPSTDVFAFGYDGTRWGAYYWMQTLAFPLRDPEPEPPPPPHGYYSTLAVGKAGFQVIGVTIPKVRFAQRAPDVFLQIWPYIGRVIWPGRFSLNDVSLESVSQSPVYGAF
jgi:hypothetical protein